MDFSVLISPFLMVNVATILLLAVFAYWNKHKGVPPGPLGLPLVGYAPFFGPNPQDKFLELGKKYGNIFSLYMGPQLTIVLNDYTAVKAAFSAQASLFAGRPDSFVFRYLSTGTDGDVHGIMLLEGEIWKTERRFMLQAFRDLGMGKAKIQDRILDEAEYMTDIFSKYAGRPFDPLPTLMSSVANVVCALCFGQRFEHSDPEFLGILANMEVTTNVLAQAGSMQSYPILRFLPGRMKNIWKLFVQASDTSKKFTLNKIEEHRRTYVGSETRDYIDAFLHQQNSIKSTGVGDQAAFRDDELLMNLQALFGAGTETTAVTLLWAMFFMIKHPEVQKKVHHELDSKIESGRSVTVEDRGQLPYLEAVCREIQRLANVTPFGVLRSNTEETTLLGYRIPKRCFIVPNFLAVNLDPTLWKDPLSFDPMRFINEHGKVYEPAQFMPFSIGKRACVGESLARMEILIFFANIMQRFEIRPAKNSVVPTKNQYEYTTGISCRPMPFEIEAIRRANK